MLINDRQITISAGASRKATKWLPQTLYLSELYDRLKTPARSTERLDEYLRLSKNKQDELKDVGGFVAGTLNGGRRKGDAVTGRDVLALDLDHIPAGSTNDVLRRIDGLGCGYCVYSTRKHSPAAPRLRVLLPLDRAATADEYEPLARKAGEIIGIKLCDPSTFEASRLMYWPSCCADSEYIFTLADKPLLSADGMLALYTDWRNATSWPQVPGTEQAHQKLASRQEDPTAKPGVVGAFCRTYDIYRTMQELLPSVYDPVDNDSTRFTYTGGSTTGGAVVYDNGAFLFSHHATDPAGGKLCNAFDLVRLHRFGELDDDAKPDTPANRLPSFVAMCELAVADASVSHLMLTERYGQMAEDFAAPADGDENWLHTLAIGKGGAIDKTADNILIILRNQPELRGRILLDDFAKRGVAVGPFPWDARPGRRVWGDNDDAGVRWFLEKHFELTGKEKIMDALSLCAREHAFDPVQQYLLSLHWDGVARLDRLFIDYLGAADTEYTRAITRKAFCAAVARAMVPGTKFDPMTILSGAQGLGKSTLLRKMGKSWFSDSLTTFIGKEARELVQGVWIIEIGELSALSKAENEQAKQFLSQCEDIFRVPYGRRTEVYPRRCVFFGTSNSSEFLRDKTGNRRFWPVDVGVQPVIKSVFTQLDAEVDQLWAEAFVRWQAGEPLYLSGAVEEAARAEQEGHREQSPREGIIRDFVEREVPLDWRKWDLQRRKSYWQGNAGKDIPTEPRTRICAMEVWCEALDSDPKFMQYRDATEINGVLAQMDGWKRTKNGVRFGYCGFQKGFEKVILSGDTL
ncbi:MAG: virulence-associated E family protein [Candidatus Fimivivens sp.]|nr:virulence-associated E family protein [Candidatus Fimivivens sp.]